MCACGVRGRNVSRASLSDGTEPRYGGLDWDQTGLGKIDTFWNGYAYNFAQFIPVAAGEDEKKKEEKDRRLH